MRTRILFALLAALLLAPEARATFVIVNNDGPGEGFNDPTPAAPVGGNPGVTVGQQRLNVFVKAGQIWDAILGSPITIQVRATFDPLPCAATSGVLGSAGPYVVETDFANAPFPATWFTAAEANRLAGFDIEPGFEDIEAQFQSNVGQPTCLNTRFWYYGFDGNEGANGIDLLPVLLHEFGHGLGFLTLTDETNGAYFNGQPSIFDRFLMDNVSNKHWIDMTPAERIASAINTTHLVWDGPAVTHRVPQFVGNRAQVVTSGALVATYEGGQGVFSPAITAGGLGGQVVLVNDGVGTTSDGCNVPFVNAAAVSGKIALMDRSATCSFAQQASNAEGAGAIAVIIINNVAGPPPPLRGAAPAVGIPCVSVTQTDGNAIRAALGGGAVNATISLDPTKLAGADNAGRMLMFAPNPDQPGSSVSHFDVTAFPNLLMEPSINPDLDDTVDLTTMLFFDIGWFPQFVGVPDRGGEAFAFAAHPNPSTTGGTLRFRLPDTRRVQLVIYDVAGRVVTHLANSLMAAGPHDLEWGRTDDHGRRVGPGVYLAQLRSGNITRTVHIVLMD